VPAVLRRLSPWLLPALVALPCVALAGDGSKVRQKLYITNSGGDDVTIADAATNKVIGKIVVGPHPHGIAAPASQDFVLVTIEGGKKGEIVWIDPLTDKAVKRMPCGPEPNQLAVTPDGKFAYVPVKDGHWEVLDLKQGKIIARLFTGGRPHNTVCSRDGKHMYLAPMGDGKKVLIAEVATHKLIGEIPFTGVVRPIALSGDEKRLYAEVDGLVGVEVADIASRKMILRVESELTPIQRKKASRSHGLGVRPDQKEVWACDVDHFEVQVFDVTGHRPRQIAKIGMGERPIWLTFSPDGKYCYVSLIGKGEAAVIDTKTREIVAHIPAGKEPKRLLVVALPERPR
jgi:YVTN family beta-propeller protein